MPKSCGPNFSCRPTSAAKADFDPARAGRQPPSRGADPGARIAPPGFWAGLTIRQKRPICWSRSPVAIAPEADSGFLGQHGRPGEGSGVPDQPEAGEAPALIHRPRASGGRPFFTHSGWDGVPQILLRSRAGLPIRRHRDSVARPGCLAEPELSAPRCRVLRAPNAMSPQLRYVSSRAPDMATKTGSDLAGFASSLRTGDAYRGSVGARPRLVGSIPA